MIETDTLNKTSLLYHDLLKKGINVTGLCVDLEEKPRIIELLIGLIKYNCSFLKGFGAPELEKSDTDVICLKNARDITEIGILRENDKPLISLWKQLHQAKNEICVLTHGVISFDKITYGHFATDLKLKGLIKTDETTVLLVNNTHNAKTNTWSFLILGIGKTKRGKKNRPKIRTLGKMIVVVNLNEQKVHELVEQHKGEICFVKKQNDTEEGLYCVIYARTSNALISAVNQ
ncbi:MAG: hypothetical protein KAS30_05765 [Candidatus Diapherotrites archaeon]|nr:hypothetical protein [Candidatus Diapherotrites archaeon]